MEKIITKKTKILGFELEIFLQAKALCLSKLAVNGDYTTVVSLLNKGISGLWKLDNRCQNHTYCK